MGIDDQDKEKGRTRTLSNPVRPTPCNKNYNINCLKNQ